MRTPGPASFGSTFGILALGALPALLLPAHGRPERVPIPVAAVPADTTTPAEVYQAACAACHGADGTGAPAEVCLLYTSPSPRD